MLDVDTRRRIDAARDILVGKVPDPKSQVEQITIALVYKFMDDMDAMSEELGGRRSFFAGEFEHYRWANLVRSGLGGHEMLGLYAEAITRMTENPGIPQLFRSIFNNAFLPYRDPETLRLFLREIDSFEYDHSERLGDAFEYLLSVLGAQGDAGQFRTPRHIIDFIVTVLDPRKDESVLDPACGTAGFLISAWKHILNTNTDGEGGYTLTPDEWERLARNFTGYDISPDMVRLSLVNMYLHGFPSPRILEYDTLTSEDHWDFHADVILANPPFMNPKGGIRPHKRFSVQSTRSEVLFVDYMAEHLTPDGRAGIIVPEGIIFQAQQAHTRLRRMLVNDYLAAVVSLPAGVFNPYSGVKTSILILDKALARQTDGIAFFKVENDGRDLGAQRREIETNDLPAVQAELAEYLRRAQAGESMDGYEPRHGFVVARSRIAEGSNYNLSAERYREHEAEPSKWPMVRLGDLAQLVRGVTYTKDDEVLANGHQILRANNINLGTASLDLSDIKNVSKAISFDDAKKLRADDVLICLASGSKEHIGKVAHIIQDTEFYFGGFMGVIRSDRTRLHSVYLFNLLRQERFNTFLRNQIAGANINNLSAEILYRFEIPLPSLDVQREIVAEVEGYQSVIDGARAVLDRYRPHVAVDPSWPVTELHKVIRTLTPPQKILTRDIGAFGKYPVIDQSQNAIAGWTDDEDATIDGTQGLVIFGDHTCSVKFVQGRFAQGADGIKIIQPHESIEPQFLYFYLLSHPLEQGGYKRHFSELKRMLIPIPPQDVQGTIAAELETERSLVQSNHELITRMESRVASAVARVWKESD